MSSRCNLNCTTCARKNRKGKQGDMTWDIFREILHKISQSKFKKSLYLSGFGEAMLNPNFFDMVKYAKQRNYSLILPTNATMITEDNIKWLRYIDLLQLSIDSLKTKERRGQNPNQILKLIPSIQKYRINTMLNVALGKENFDEIDDFLMLYKRTNIPINFVAVKPFYKTDKILINEMKHLALNIGYLKEIIKPYPEVYLDESCRSFEYGRMRNNDFAIAWNGDMFPCSYAFFTDFSFGNIKDYSSLESFWQSEEIQKVRKGTHPICDFCKWCDNIRLEANKKEIDKKNSIGAFKNKHKGKRCFILGTGHSLTKDTINKLRNEITIGVNGIYFAKEKYDFEPTYICFTDRGCVTDEEDFNAIKKIKSTKIYSSFLHYHALGIDNSKLSKNQIDFLSKCVCIKWKNAGWGVVFHLKDANDISFDLENEGTAMCGTVIQDLAIPLAVWLGCKDIYLLGCDCTIDGHYYDNKNVTNNLNQYGYNQYKYFNDKIENETDSSIYNLTPSIISGIKNKTLGDILKHEDTSS